MRKLVQQRSHKAGMPPGSLVHIGRKKREKMAVTVFEYNDQSLKEKEVDIENSRIPYQDKSTVTWVNVDGIHDVEALGKLAKHFGLHPLVQEDILNTDQRPKLENYDSYLYVVVKMLYYAEKIDEMLVEQVSFILGDGYLISFQEGREKGKDVFDSVRDRLRHNMGKLRKMGADFLLYSLLDAIVDNYFLVIEKLGDNIEATEEVLITKPSRPTLQTIHYLKREIMFLHKCIWPLREVTSGLQRRATSLVSEETELYVRDVYDHVIQVMDTTETFRDMLAGMLDIYLSSVSNRMNEVMKVLTVISTIFIPLTFIAGVYGMNFRYMPELELPWGYPAIWGIMIAIGVGLLIYFKRKRWL